MTEDVIEGIGHEQIGKHTSSILQYYIILQYYTSSIQQYYNTTILFTNTPPTPKDVRIPKQTCLGFKIFLFYLLRRSFAIWKLLEEDGQLYNTEKMEVWIFRKAGKNTKW